MALLHERRGVDRDERRARFRLRDEDLEPQVDGGPFAVATMRSTVAATG